MVGGVVVVAIITVLLLAPDTVVRFVQNIADLHIVARLFLVIVLYGLGLLAAYAQFRLAERRPHKGLAVKASGAETALSVESARERILKAVSEVPGVAEARADIKPVRGRADITLDVVVDNKEANIPEKQKEILRALDKVVKKQLGLMMAGRPTVQISFGAGAASSPPAQAAAELDQPDAAENLFGRMFTGKLFNREKAEAEPAAPAALQSAGAGTSTAADSTDKKGEEEEFDFSAFVDPQAAQPMAPAEDIPGKTTPPGPAAAPAPTAQPNSGDSAHSEAAPAEADSDRPNSADAGQPSPANNPDAWR